MMLVVVAATSTDYQEQHVDATSSPGSSSGKGGKNKNNKGEEASGGPSAYTTRAQLYKVIPQDIYKAYLAEAVLIKYCLFSSNKRRCVKVCSIERWKL